MVCKFLKNGGQQTVCDDLREQTKLPETALLPVAALPALVVPAMQLSAEANAIVAAIDGALVPRLDWIQGAKGLTGGAGDEPEI